MTTKPARSRCSTNRFATVSADIISSVLRVRLRSAYRSANASAAARSAGSAGDRLSVGHGREWRDRDGRSCLHLSSFPYDRMKAVWPDDLPSPTVSNIVPSVKPERSYESYRFIQAVEAPENLDISLPNDTKPLV